MKPEVTIVAFHPRHIEVMDLRAEEKEGMFALPDIYRRIEGIWEQSLQAGTVFYDGRIILCFGFRQLWPGVCEGWIIPSVYFKHFPVFAARTVRRYVDTLFKTFKFHRFQAVSYDSEEDARWMKFLKFEKEGTMKMYSYQKKNYCMYARVS